MLRMSKKNPISNLQLHLILTQITSYNPSQKLLAQLRKTMLCHKPQAIENSFKRPYGEVEDNIIIYIYIKDLRLKDLGS